MILQNRSIKLDYLSINLGCAILQWEIYIEENDFPKYPGFRQKYGITLYVKQYQFVKDDHKGKILTKFFLGKGKAWNHSTKDPIKKEMAIEAENFILNHTNPLVGHINAPIDYKFIPKDIAKTMPEYDGILF